MTFSPNGVASDTLLIRVVIANVEMTGIYKPAI